MAGKRLLSLRDPTRNCNHSILFQAPPIFYALPYSKRIAVVRAALVLYSRLARATSFSPHFLAYLARIPQHGVLADRRA